MTKEAITPIGPAGKRDAATILSRYNEQLAAAAEESSHREIPPNLRHVALSSDSAGRPGVAVHGVPVAFPSASPKDNSHVSLIAATQPTKTGLVLTSQALSYQAEEASHDFERVQATSGSPLAVDFASSPVGQLLNNFLSVKPAEIRVGLPQARMAATGIEDMAAIAQAQQDHDLMVLVLQSAIAQLAQQLRAEHADNDTGYNAALLGHFMGIRQRFAEVRAGNDRTARTQARHLERAYTRALGKPAAEPFKVYHYHAQTFAKARVPTNNPSAIATAIQALPPKAQAALAQAGNALASPSLLTALAAAMISMANQKALTFEQHLAYPTATDKKVSATQVPKDQRQNNEMELRALLAFLSAAKDVLLAQEANKEEQARDYARRKDDERRQDDAKMREKARVVRDLSTAIHQVNMLKNKIDVSPTFRAMYESELAALSQAAAALTATAAAATPPPTAI